MSHDFYGMLELPPTATSTEIRGAYRKLVVQHHPDKGGNTTKFREIQMAYETLSSPQRRQQYDLMNHYERYQLHQLLQEYFDVRVPGGQQVYQSLIKLFYPSPEEFADDLNQFRLGKILYRLRDGVSQNCREWLTRLTDQESASLISSRGPLPHHSYRLHSCLADRYSNRYQRVVLNGIRYHIPLRENEVWFGEDRTTEICFLVETESESGWEVDGHHLHGVLPVTLEQFLYGGEVWWMDPAGEPHLITIPDLHHRSPQIKLPHLGLPFTPVPEDSPDEDHEIVPGETEVQRGDLWLTLQLPKFHDPEWRKQVAQIT